MSPSFEKKALYGIIGGMFIITMATVGAVYASLDNRINAKADKSAFDIVQKEIEAMHESLNSHIIATGAGKVVK